MKQKTKTILTITALLLAATVSAQAKAKKKAKPTPTPAVTANFAAMNKVLRLAAYEKGGEFIGDVIGIVDAKSKKVVLKCNLSNLSNKEIHGVRGLLRFTTMFGDYIGDLSLETTAIIPPGGTLSVEWKAGAERFSEEGLKTFQKLKLDQMRQLWYPTMVVFTDGTILK